ncbi:MAG TPA: hypothetical protein VKB80_21560, partial [Kofleriaceae bacterium]|nr:hypothetical protein [Kofleriaceae bacterium]
RAYYYYHTPRGRAHAVLVAEPIPPFYARCKLDYRAPAVRGRVRVAIYEPPIIRPSVHVRRTVYIRAPRVGWYASVRTHVHPAPARVTWYVRPRTPRARVVYGARPSASVRVKTVFRAVPPRPRAQAVVRFGGRVDVRDHRTPDRVEVRDHRRGGDVRAGAAAGVRIGAGAPAVEVRDHASGAVRGGAAVRIGAGAGARGREVREVRDHRTRVEAGGGARGSARASAGARVQVKAPKIKVKPPRVKASVKVKGGVKIGH